LGDTLLSACYFFHTISQFSRKLCIFGCSSQLGDIGKKSGALGTAVMMLIPKDEEQHTKSIHPSTAVTNSACDVVLLQQTASCKQVVVYHTQSTSRNPCLSRDTKGRKKNKNIYTHSLLARHLSSAAIPHKVRASHH